MDTPLEDTEAFLLDVMLGKLAVYLRMCGFDAAYAGDRGMTEDEALLRLADAEDRVLLSRDIELVELPRAGLLIHGREIADQLDELRAAGLELELTDPPTRCGRCNGILEPEPSRDERPAYAPADPATDCYRCRSCGQYFWKGSHWDAVNDVL